MTLTEVPVLGAILIAAGMEAMLVERRGSGKSGESSWLTQQRARFRVGLVGLRRRIDVLCSGEPVLFTIKDGMDIKDDVASIT